MQNFLPHLRRLMAIFRRVVLVSMVIVLGAVSVSCTAPSSVEANNSPQVEQSSAQTVRLPDGQYPVQQATYDDGSGDYRLALLNTPPGQPSMVQLANLPMARVTDAEASQGSYLKVEQGQPSLHLTEDFKIEYVHNVTETVADPQTGQPQTVVVRQESSFWTPFAGALIGQAVGNMLFTPHYYMPPVYQPGVVLTGYGGYGRSYDQAVSNYRTRYQAPPAEVKNRQVFRSTGRLRTPTATPRRTSTQSRPSGSGFGSSTLRPSGTQQYRPKPSSRSFGSGAARRPARRR